MIFPNAACTTALIDRVVHHADIIAIEGDSYRRREPQAAKPSRRAKARGGRRTNASGEHAHASVDLMGIRGFCLVVAAFVWGACGAPAPAYPAVGKCLEMPDKPADWCDGPITRIGVVSSEEYVWDGQRSNVYAIDFQDLENVDPYQGQPLLYGGSCKGCPLVEGRSYLARLSKEGKLYSILLDGEELIAGVTNENGPSLSGANYDALGRSTVFFENTCWHAPGHWEKLPAPDGSAGYLTQCVEGKDTRPWPLAGPSDQASLPPCNEHPGFANQTVWVVVSVQPPAGMEWLFDEAPAEIAHLLLYDLQQNVAGIEFREASGVEPTLRIDVTVTQLVEGTEQDTAEARVSGTDNTTLFTMTSGEAPFTSMPDAIRGLASNLLGYFTDGWNSKRPCVKRDNTVLR